MWHWREHCHTCSLPAHPGQFKNWGCVSVIYCQMTNYHKLSSLEQHPAYSSIGQKSCTVWLGSCSGCHRIKSSSLLRLWFSSGPPGPRLNSRIIVGILFLVAVGLRSPFSIAVRQEPLSAARAHGSSPSAVHRMDVCFHPDPWSTSLLLPPGKDSLHLKGLCD